MNALIWIVRVLVLLIILRILLRMLFGPGRRPGSPRPAPRAPERLGGELVRDPQCGTFIPKARAIVSGSGADAKYFCSVECRDQYEKLHGS